MSVLWNGQAKKQKLEKPTKSKFGRIDSRGAVATRLRTTGLGGYANTKMRNCRYFHFGFNFLNSRGERPVNQLIKLGYLLFFWWNQSYKKLSRKNKNSWQFCHFIVNWFVRTNCIIKIELINQLDISLSIFRQNTFYSIDDYTWRGIKASI